MPCQCRCDNLELGRHPTAFVALSQHQPKNSQLDQMMQWVHARYLPFHLLRGLMKPEGAKQLPFERGY